MASVYDRPFSWLYVLATVGFGYCVLMFGVQQFGQFWYFTVGVAVGQAWWVAGWSILGSAHRLVRGAAVLLTIAWSATLFCSDAKQVGLDWNVWGDSFAPICVMSAAALVAATIARMVRRWRGGREASRQLRFRIAEAFGWTAVVAGSSWALGEANFSNLTNSTKSFVFAVSASLVAGAAMAIGYRSIAESRCGHLLLAFGAMLSFIVISSISIELSDRSLRFGSYWGLAYVSLGLLAHNADCLLFSQRASKQGRASSVLSTIDNE